MVGLQPSSYTEAKIRMAIVMAVKIEKLRRQRLEEECRRRKYQERQEHREHQHRQEPKHDEDYDIGPGL